MSLIVQKYGGSSLSSPAKIRQAAKRIEGRHREGHALVVVVSAMGYTTDHLLKLAHRTVKRPSERELDMLLTVGERVSMSLVAMVLEELGIAAISFTGSQSGIITTNKHLDARILRIQPQRIYEELEKKKVVIIAGFQGVSEKKEITSLGRGGSDTTAVALASVLKAERCEILTDVKGLYTADPRKVPNAKLIGECDYDEALEYARLGAKMQARSIEMAKRYQMKVSILSSSDLESTGTLIHEKKGRTMEHAQIHGIATKEGITYFEFPHPLKESVEFLQRHQCYPMFFSAQESKISWVVSEETAPKLERALEKEGLAYKKFEEVGLVSAVGQGLSSSPKEVLDFLEILQPHEALMFNQNALSISAIVPKAHLATAARELHRKFIKNTQR